MLALLILALFTPIMMIFVVIACTYKLVSTMERQTLVMSRLERHFIPETEPIIEDIAEMKKDDNL